MEPLGENQLSTESGKRSRKWIIAIVLIAVVIPIVMTVGIIGLVLGGLYYGSKSTQEFECAMSEINRNKEAIELLGAPIEDGYLVMPNIEISGSERRVNFSVPVTGSIRSGSLLVNSYRDSFRSDFLMQLTSDGKKVVLHRGSFPCGEK